MYILKNLPQISQVDILEILDETLEREFLEGVTAISKYKKKLIKENLET